MAAQRQGRASTAQGRAPAAPALKTWQERRQALLEETQAFIAEFEATQLPEYTEAKELVAQLTGRTPTPMPVPDRPSRGRQTRGRQNPDGARKGSRADQALQLITSRPGITIPLLAEELGIEPNYLYRIVPGLQRTGKVTKDGDGGWHAVNGDGLTPSPERVAELEAAKAS